MPDSDYTINETPCMRIIKNAAEHGAMAAFSRIMQGGMNLDNFTADCINMPESEDGMKHKVRVRIDSNDDGTPVYKYIQANGLDELNDRIVAAYVKSGRIWEFMRKPEKPQTAQMTTLAEYAEKWLTVYKAGKLKPAAMATYRKHLHAHVLPAFGNRSIASITTEDIQLFLNERKHLAEKTLRSMLHFMGEIFKDAIEDGLTEKDPTASRRICIPSKKSYDREALPIEQFKEIMRGLDLLEPQDKRMLALMMFTGMRRSVSHCNGNQPIIGTPKSKSGKRDIPIDELLLNNLQPIGDEGFVIGGESPLTMTMYNNAMKRIRKKLNLHGATAHVFRHSYLTYLAGTGADSKTIQTIAGHSTITMTMNKYVHPQAENLKAAGEQMHSLLVS